MGIGRGSRVHVPTGIFIKEYIRLLFRAKGHYKQDTFTSLKHT